MSRFELQRIVYVLRLQDYCWYVGMCTVSGWRSRWWAHLAGKGSSWTKLHKPLCLEEKWEFKGDWRFGELLENKRCIEYALKYGVENVRGGHYCVSGVIPSRDTMLVDYGRILESIESSKYLEQNGWNDLPTKKINTVGD